MILGWFLSLAASIHRMRTTGSWRNWTGSRPHRIRGYRGVNCTTRKGWSGLEGTATGLREGRRWLRITKRRKLRGWGRKRHRGFAVPGPGKGWWYRETWTVSRNRRPVPGRMLSSKERRLNLLSVQKWKENNTDSYFCQFFKIRNIINGKICYM